MLPLDVLSPFTHLDVAISAIRNSLQFRRLLSLILQIGYVAAASMLDVLLVMCDGMQLDGDGVGLRWDTISWRVMQRVADICRVI